MKTEYQQKAAHLCAAFCCVGAITACQRRIRFNGLSQNFSFGAVLAESSVPTDHIVQVSLDGGNAADHNAYRGKGTWIKTLEGIQLLQERGFRVRISTTETPANRARLATICLFHRQLGIPEEDHLVRPLAKRGYSTQGIELSMANLAPEVTVNLGGVFWHPLSTDGDMQVNRKLFPLATSVERIQTQLNEIARTGGSKLMNFKRCRPNQLPTIPTGLPELPAPRRAGLS